MPITINNTPGDPSANSYAAQSDLIAYASVRLPAIAWAVAAIAQLPSTPASDQLNASLIAAARELDVCFTWTGVAISATQARAFPRNGMLTRNGFPIDPTINPPDLIAAQCEFALQLGASDLLSDLAQLKQSVQSIKAGSVQLGFQPMDKGTIESMDIYVRRQGPRFNAVSNVVPDEVRRLLVPSWFRMPRVRRDAIISFAGGSGSLGIGFGFDDHNSRGDDD